MFTIFTNPSARAGYDTRSIFKRSLTGFEFRVSFSKTSCLIKAEEPSLSYHISITGERIIGFIPFPRVLVLCEMQSASARIWIRVAVSISYDDNHWYLQENMFTNHIYFIYMNQQDLALNNPESLICHKIKSNQIKWDDSVIFIFA